MPTWANYQRQKRLDRRNRIHIAIIAAVTVAGLAGIWWFARGSWF